MSRTGPDPLAAEDETLTGRGLARPGPGTAQPTASTLNQGDYERPQQAWRCGHDDGTTCTLGPDRHGRCQAGPLCRPRKVGDRWQCTRPGSAGGPCSQGPTPDGACTVRTPPCSPRPTLRTVRGRIVRWGLVLTLGALLVVLHGPLREAMLSPGPISIHHRTIESCASCHGGFEAGPTGWLMAAFDPDHRHADGDLCLNCHRLGDYPFNAHAQAPERLAALRREIAQHTASQTPRPPVDLALAAAVLAPDPDALGPVACRTCHHEHTGTIAPLTETSNADCQICHSVRFRSIGNGHPEIRHILSGRRQRIKFDHNAHFDRHFRDGSVADHAPETCITCHKPGPQGRNMITVGFDTACGGACHGGDVKGATATGRKGIAVLTAPGLDLFEFEARGIDIGAWPPYSEEAVTPFLETLLRGDPGAASALDRLAGLDLLDLRPASAEEIEAAARLAVAVKTLMAKLLMTGHTHSPDMLAPADDRTEAESGTLLALLPFEEVRAAQQAWFPDLSADPTQSLPILPDPVPGPASAPASDPLEAPAEEPDQGDILNGPSGGGDDILDGLDSGGGDDILGGLDSGGGDDILGGLDSGTDGGDDILGGLDSGGGGEDILGGLDSGGGGGDILGGLGSGGGGGDILGGLGSGTDGGDDILGGLDSSGGGGDDILGDLDGGGGGDILGGLGSGTDGGDDILGGLDSGDGGDSGTEIQQAAPPLEPAVSREAWMALGGWYRQDSALLYRPTGHADPFLHAWLDVAVAWTGNDAADPELSSLGGRLLAVIGAEKSPGMCLRCHSVDAPGEPSGRPTINWYAEQPDPQRRTFTQFNHADHFSLVDKKGCQHCHSLTHVIDADGFAAQFVGPDPTAQVVPDFFGPHAAECAECHTENAAGDDCTLCHRYHVGRFPERMPLQTPMTAAHAPADK